MQSLKRYFEAQYHIAAGTVNYVAISVRKLEITSHKSFWCC